MTSLPCWVSSRVRPYRPSRERYMKPPPGSPSRASSTGRARGAIRSSHEELSGDAVTYIFSVSPHAAYLVAEFVNHESRVIAQSALQAITGQKEIVESLITHEWLLGASSSDNPDRRALAAFAVGIRGDEGTAVLHDLLRDRSRRVVTAAIHAAGVLQNRAYLNSLVNHLASASLRSAALEGLICYGETIAPVLGAMMRDAAVPSAIRRQIPRALAGIPAQPSVDTLEACFAVGDLNIRTAGLKALYRLREIAPELKYDKDLITLEIRREAESISIFMGESTDSATAGAEDGPLRFWLARLMSV